jgi:hypothetical protein
MMFSVEMGSRLSWPASSSSSVGFLQLVPERVFYDTREWVDAYWRKCR